LLIRILILLLCASSCCALTLPGDYDYSFGEWNPVIEQSKPGGIFVTARFDDFDSPYQGFNFSVLKDSGRVYPLLPLNKWGINPLVGYSSVYYPKGFSRGTAYMPGYPAYSPLCSHRVELHAQMRAESSFGNWLLQTDKRWSAETYGRYSDHTIGQLGCYLMCCVMQISANSGMSVDPIDLNNYLKEQKDGYMGKGGLLVNLQAVARYATEELNYPMRACTSMSINEALTRGLTVHAKCKDRGHFVYPYAKRWNGTSMDYLIFDPMGRGHVSSIPAYGGLIEGGARVLIPVRETNPVAVRPSFADVGNSCSIAGYMDDGMMSFELCKSPTERYFSHIETLENYSERIIEAQSMAPGLYNLITYGAPNRNYTIILYTYGYIEDVIVVSGNTSEFGADCKLVQVY